MYDYIKGNVSRITPEYITIETNGIGYQLLTPNPYSFKQTSEEQTIYTYLHVREDAHLLFGFKKIEQRELFKKLIQVSGIGPKGALAIIGSGQPDQVIQAIEREDESFLVKFPGVGKKTARQMILDLKGKLHDLIDPSAMDDLMIDFVDWQDPTSQHELEEALLALSALGYSEKELSKIRPKLTEQSEELDTEGYMKKALQLLLKQT